MTFNKSLQIIKPLFAIEINGARLRDEKRKIEMIVYQKHLIGKIRGNGSCMDRMRS
jgi:hypothetical protein